MSALWNINSYLLSRDSAPLQSFRPRNFEKDSGYTSLNPPGALQSSARPPLIAPGTLWICLLDLLQHVNAWWVQQEAQSDGSRIRELVHLSMS